MQLTANSALVTGATGFIGGHLARRLIEDGWSVRVLARNPARLATEISKHALVVPGDLADAAALREAVRGVAVIFHCAANVKTWDEYKAYHAANVHGIENLIAAVATENKVLTRLVHLSTADVYGFPRQPCDESASMTASGFGYGDSKREGEILLRRLCAERGIPFVVLRPANVMGPRSPFIERIGDALRSGVMLMVDGGRANAGFLDVGNLLGYMLWAAHAPQAAGQCYNVRDVHDIDWASFLRDFRAQIGGNGRIINLPFGVAMAVARLLESGHRLMAPAREPLLHPLLVYMFGRTCGHLAGRIRADSGMDGRVGYQEAMDASVHWYLQERVQ